MMKLQYDFKKLSFVVRFDFLQLGKDDLLYALCLLDFSGDF